MQSVTSYTINLITCFYLHSNYINTKKEKNCFLFFHGYIMMGIEGVTGN